MKSVEEQKRLLKEAKEDIKNPMDLRGYIKAYRYQHKHTIDMSPYGVARDTERRMLSELEKLIK